MSDAVAASGTVIARREGAVAILSLSYPERRNALSLPLRAVLLAELEKAVADESCRVIVITGDGAHFCSGGDISSFDGITPPLGRVRMQRVHPIVRLIVRGEKPVIAAVEGMPRAPACALPPPATSSSRRARRSSPAPSRASVSSPISAACGPCPSAWDRAAPGC